MKHPSPAAVLAGLAILAAAVPAFAQNAGEIARARAGANCPHCNLFQADFANLDLKGKDFAGSRLRQADMSASDLAHTSFAGTDFRDVNAYGAVFTGSDFAHVNLTNASFVGAYLQGADFRGARLDGVNFSGAEMTRAVGLSQAQLSGACGDPSTHAPAGLSLKACR